MKNAIIVTALLLAVACNKKEEPPVNDNGGIVLVIPGEAIASAYDEHRKNNKHTTIDIDGRLKDKGYKVEDNKIVEISLDRMSFNKAFDIQRRAKGGGHIFWWRGSEYTTDLEGE